MAPPLLHEAVDASECLGDGEVENEVGEGEERDGDPLVSASKLGGKIG